jgi:hypothetical protein
MDTTEAEAVASQPATLVCRHLDGERHWDDRGRLPSSLDTYPVLNCAQMGFLRVSSVEAHGRLAHA